jgi:hypothetical protein
MIFLLAGMAVSNEWCFGNHQLGTVQKGIAGLNFKGKLQAGGFYTGKLTNCQVNFLHWRSLWLGLPPIPNRQNQGPGHVSFVHVLDSYAKRTDLQILDPALNPKNPGEFDKGNLPLLSRAFIPPCTRFVNLAASLGPDAEGQADLNIAAKRKAGTLEAMNYFVFNYS